MNDRKTMLDILKRNCEELARLSARTDLETEVIKDAELTVINAAMALAGFSWDPDREQYARGKWPASEGSRPPERPVFEIQCIVCGNTFKTDNKRRKYCSQRCRSDAYIERRNERKQAERQKLCPVCGKRFRAANKATVYCSGACKQKAYRLNKTENPKYIKIPVVMKVITEEKKPLLQTVKVITEEPKPVTKQTKIPVVFVMGSGSKNKKETENRNGKK